MNADEEKIASLILQHKESIAKLMAKFCGELTYRAAIHDETKFHKDEFENAVECVHEFNKYEFDSPEERKLREKMDKATTYHRAHNRHHPEYFPNGINDMNLIDVIEMLADWKSASTRSPSNSIRKSLPILQEKYNISPQLYQILTNTLRDFNMY